jgi:hypothetical protein
MSAIVTLQQPVLRRKVCTHDSMSVSKWKEALHSFPAIWLPAIWRDFFQRRAMLGEHSSPGATLRR